MTTLSLSCSASLVAVAVVATGCSLGEGNGKVFSERLVATDCWDGEYDMKPDFFAAVAYRQTLQIRIQRGSDLQEVSDGLSVLVDDIAAVRGALGNDFVVSLPAGVAPPGSPVGQSPTQGSLVHMALYLQQSCHNTNTILYSVGGTINFSALFNGDPNEKDAKEKLTTATFDVMVGNPSDVPLGASGEDIPLDLQTHLTGDFDFYFQRGQPAQPFP